MKIYYNIMRSSFIASINPPLYTPYINGKFEGYGIDHEISNVWYEGIDAYHKWKREKEVKRQKI
jgi:hypothetical protein